MREKIEHILSDFVVHRNLEGSFIDIMELFAKKEIGSISRVVGLNQKLESKIADLTEDLEQCKIELQTAYDRIHDLEAELHSIDWDRPLH